jgi:hypothetical protein
MSRRQDASNEIMPWDRLSGESTPAFEAFTLYRDSGLKRSIAKVATELGKSTKLLERWSRHHMWVERVRAYDVHMDQVQVQEQEKQRREMAERHARIALSLQTKAIERLKSLNAEDLDVDAVLRYVVEAAKLERLARGESTERTDINVHDIDAAIERELARVATGGEGTVPEATASEDLRL